MIASAYPHLHMLPHAILSDIGQHAEGNPYFLTEIIKSLSIGNLNDVNIDPQMVRDQLVSQIPEALRATLQARMDSLSREARTVALVASVVGRVFWVGAVLAAARSTPLPGSTPLINVPESVIDRYIQGGLRQLVRAELASPRGGSAFSDDQEYIFKNSYLRDVAYSLIPNRNRVQYHRAVAEWMTQIDDPNFQSLAREHERKAETSAKISMGDNSITQPAK
jgi:predicted ATPase